MAQSSINFLERLKELITAPGFKTVSSTMYVPQIILRDFAQTNGGLQFLVMKECDGKYIVYDVSMFASFRIHTIGQFVLYEKSVSHILYLSFSRWLGAPGRCFWPTASGSKEPVVQRLRQAEDVHRPPP